MYSRCRQSSGFNCPLNLFNVKKGRFVPKKVSRVDNPTYAWIIMILQAQPDLFHGVTGFRIINFRFQDFLMQSPALQTPTHSWLKQLTISYVPGPSTELSDQVASGLIRHFNEEGHATPTQPSPETDVILTTALL